MTQGKGPINIYELDPKEAASKKEARLVCRLVSRLVSRRVSRLVSRSLGPLNTCREGGPRKHVVFLLFGRGGVAYNSAADYGFSGLWGAAR
jgi:hypothetical protein